MPEKTSETVHPGPEDAGVIALGDFSAQLSVLIDSGVSLVGAFDRLGRTSADPEFFGVVDAIRQDMIDGNPLSASMAKHPTFFCERYIAAIREGELKGALEVVLRELASGAYVPNAILGYSEQFGDISRAVYIVAGKYKTVDIEPEHYLLGLLTPPDNDTTARFVKSGVDIAGLRADVEAYLASLPRKTNNDWSRYSPALTAISDTAYQIANGASAPEVTPLHYLTAFVRAEGTMASKLLRQRGVRIETV